MFLAPGSVGQIGNPHAPSDGVGVTAEQILADLTDELTTAGILSKLDLLCVNVGSQSLVNLKAPGTNNLTNTGGATLNAQGYSGDGVDAHLATGLVPPGTGNYKKDDASAGVWVTRQDVTSTGDFVLGAVSGDTLRIAPRVGVSGVRTRLNCSGSNDGYTVEATGLIALRRNNSANYDLFKHGQFHKNLVVASTATPSGAITFLRTATSYSPTTTTIAAEWVGAYLTDAEMVAIHSAIGRALVSLGVISQIEYSSQRGATTWFNEPRAISLDADTVLAGGVGLEGSIVGNFLVDGDAGRQSIISPRYEVDDHDNPGFLKRASDSRVLAFFCQHTGDNYWVSLSADAACSSWGTSVDIGTTTLGADFYSYAQPVQLTGEVDDPVHLFLRAKTGADDYTLHHAVLDDDGVVTAAAERVLTGTRPYFKVAANGDSRIDIFCNDGHPSDVATNGVYHFYYEGGSWFDSLDNDLGAVPFTPSADLTEVWDGATAAGRAWVWSGEIVSGSPRVAFAVFPTTSDHRYRVGTLSGGVWTTEEVCAAGGYLYAGEPYYSGGICLDPDNASVVFCSRQVDGSGNIDAVSGVHQLFKYTKSGSVWSGQQLTTGANPSFRPFVVPGTRKLTYVTGSYTSYTVFDTRVTALPI